MSQLARDLRPSSLEGVLGNESAKSAIQSFAVKSYWPNVFLLYGDPGCGKTTLARIIAKKIQPEETYIHELNASSQNKTEDAKKLEDDSYSLGFNGLPRVFILNEFDRYTDDAQRVLKDPLEKSPSVWIITTNRFEKIDVAIRSRATAATFRITSISEQQTVELAERALIHVNPDGVWQPKTDEAAAWLFQHGIREPRDILGALDLFFSGVPIEQACARAITEPLYRDVCGAVLRGDWAKTSFLLAQIKTADSRGLVSVLSAFLRGELIKNPIGPKADSLAACLVGVDSLGYADGTAYGAAVGLMYKVCKALGAR